jgi:hypothetical protein
MVVWAGPRDDMGAVEKRKMSFTCRKSNPSSTVVATRRVIMLSDIYILSLSFLIDLSTLASY